uniref:DUF3408 domain-containing protein n=1 Tax=uncultured Bacteroides sp. TaxID=162156 RepID=UPI0025DDB344|nr:DUF3408 domain-containing protein [uncultured Bacteroides sp.]
MTSKKRTVYDVDEDALKRVMAGDTTALEKIKESEKEPEREILASEPPEVKEKKPSGEKKSSQPYSFDEYRKQFLQMKLTGARRQTYIHDSLYKAFARVLPVIAPEMSVPTFVNSVLSDHLEKYQDIINAMYNREANQKPIEWNI